MSAPAKKSFLKVILGGMLGLGTGAAAMYFNAAFDAIIKPAKPLANFQVSSDGLTVTCENRATGQSGYWDFGDGTALEPYDPNLQSVQHTYAKAGKYDVKLIVRNFLMEEADRSVNVDITSGPAGANAPKVLNLKVEAIRDQVPATFRITGQVTNADELIWRLGDKTEHLAALGETIDRYVTFDTAGNFPIVLTALSKTRKEPQVVVQAVEVKRPAQDVYEAMIAISDTMMKVESRQHLVRLPAPVRDAKGPTKGFNRAITASVNGFITKAELHSSMPAVVKNVKIEIAKDQKNANVSGEWTTPSDAMMKLAGGSDLVIPVSVTEELRSMSTPQRQVLSGVMDANQMISVALPPKRMGTTTRSVSVDFGISRRDSGRSRIAFGTLDANGQWQSAPLNLGGQTVVVRAMTRNDKVELTFAKPR